MCLLVALTGGCTDKNIPRLPIHKLWFLVTCLELGVADTATAEFVGGRQASMFTCRHVSIDFDWWVVRYGWWVLMIALLLHG
jgi:hypothetical protein